MERAVYKMFEIRLGYKGSIINETTEVAVEVRDVRVDVFTIIDGPSALA